jgi:hypothetical protein
LAAVSVSRETKIGKWWLGLQMRGYNREDFLLKLHPEWREKIEKGKRAYIMYIKSLPTKSIIIIFNEILQ